MRVSVTLRSGLLMAAVTAALVAVPGPVHASATAYHLVDLGTLGGESSYVTAINDNGAVVGSSATADGTFHGFVWRGGTMTDLGELRPTDINDHGQIVGTVDTASGTRAVLRSQGRNVDLGTLGGRFTAPVAINDGGQVVGTGSTATGRQVPFFWSHGWMRTLRLDSVSGVNDNGKVAGGRAVAGGGFHAATQLRATVTDLGAGPFDRSNAYGVNNHGWVIGWTFSADQRERGALWRHGVRTDVGTLGGGRTHLVSVNDNGQILGVSQASDGSDRPALWQSGTLVDLTARGVVGDVDVVDINDDGVIAASIRPVSGVSHAAVYR